MTNIDVLNKIKNKHVTVFRKDGNILQGFVVSISEDYIELIELDNNSVIFDRSCVDLIRQGVIFDNMEEEKSREKAPEIVVSKKVNRPVEEPYCPGETCMSSSVDEFSMSVSDSPYEVPSFLRTTSRDE